jgi:phosphoribosyl-AMP cyclohydrolase
VILLKVEQVDGIACHTGRHSCFFQLLEASPEGAGYTWQETSSAPLPDDADHE